MFGVVDKAVYGMAGLRFLSSFVEMSGALLMLYFGTATKALQVNAALAMVGPTVLVLVTMFGVSAMTADGIPIGKVVCIVLGVLLILYGARR